MRRRLLTLLALLACFPFLTGYLQHRLQIGGGGGQYVGGTCDPALIRFGELGALYELRWLNDEGDLGWLLGGRVGAAFLRFDTGNENYATGTRLNVVSGGIWAGFTSRWFESKLGIHLVGPDDIPDFPRYAPALRLRLFPEDAAYLAGEIGTSPTVVTGGLWRAVLGVAAVDPVLLEVGVGGFPYDPGFVARLGARLGEHLRVDADLFVGFGDSAEGDCGDGCEPPWERSELGASVSVGARF